MVIAKDFCSAPGIKNVPACFRMSKPYRKSIVSAITSLFLVLPSFSVDRKTAICSQKVCMYSNEARHRPGKSGFRPVHINPHLCTHIIYGNSGLQYDKLVATEVTDSSSSLDIGDFDKVTTLKRANSKLKVILGFQSTNTRDGDNTEFREMMKNKGTRKSFIVFAIVMLLTYNFDGLDLHYVYDPASPELNYEHTNNFILLLMELRTAFDKHSSKLLLTASCTAIPEVLTEYYAFHKIAISLDWIHLLVHDFKESFPSATRHPSPLYNPDGRYVKQSLNWLVNFAIDRGIEKEKIVPSLALYGRSFTLIGTDSGLSGAATIGKQGPYTRTPGFLAYFELCRFMNNSEAEVYYIENQAVPYMIYRGQWIGYEDADSLRKKINFIQREGLGGFVAHRLDLDDFSGTFCNQGPYPLLTAINQECG